MELNFAFLCDFAQQEQSKLHAIGVGWDTIFAPGVPATHPMLYFVANLRGSVVENGTKNVVLRIIDADGQDIMPPNEQQVPFEVKRPNIEGNLALVMGFVGLQFPKYGSYAVHLVVQGREEATVRFHIVKPSLTG